MIAPYTAAGPDLDRGTVYGPGARAETAAGPSLTEALADLRGHLEALAEGRRQVRPGDGSAATPPRLAQIGRALGLSPFEETVLLLAGFAELEPEADAAIAAAQGHGRLGRPTVGLALSLCDGAHWSAFAPDRPLRRLRLVTLDGAGVTGRAIVPSERLLNALLGVEAPDETIAATALSLAPPSVLAPTTSATAERVAAAVARAAASARGPAVALCGPAGSGRTEAAAAAATRLGGRAWLIDARDLPVVPRDRSLLADLWAREWRLARALPVIDLDGPGGPSDLTPALAFARSVEAPVLLLAAEAPVLGHRPVVRIDLSRPPAAEQASLWAQALGTAASTLDPAVLDDLAATFTLAPGAIRSVAETALAEPGDSGDEGAGAPLARRLWRACRRQARPRLDELARRVEGMSGWEAIVLPEPQMDALRTIAAQVRQRRRVYEDWGFAGKGERGLGINALFAGQSGTGKTLAAEILGTALDLDVYRIDLSSVISKWIGETEKNLRRVFDAAEDCGAILLFDEADALFGKRSEVKDSHDRYANVEVSYLLQRMEAYRGLAILTTNMRSHIDDAFSRRIRFLIEFPFPGATEREAIWRRTFPDSVPRDGLDWARLAQLNLAGGHIRTIAINAAFRAADAGGPVTMAHILAAARAESAKLGRPLTRHELTGWPPQMVAGGAP